MITTTKNVQNKKTQRTDWKNTWRNLAFLWKICFKAAPGFMIYFLYDAFRYQMMIFLEHTLGIQYVLHCAEYGEPFYKALICVGGILLINMIQIIPDGYFAYGLKYMRKPKIYKELKEKLYAKASELDLSCYDNPEYYNDFVLAVAESDTCLDRFLEMLNSAVQSITILFTTGVFYLLTDSVGILFVLGSFVMRFILAKPLNALNVKVRTQVNPLERKRNYVSRVFYLNDYAKELRQNKKVGEILKEDFREANAEMEEMQRKVSKKRVILMFLRNYVTGDFIVDGLYVAYLIFQAAVFHTIDYSNAVVLFNRTGSLRGCFKGLAELGPQANENSLYVDKIQTFLKYEPQIIAKPGIDTSKGTESVPRGTGEICFHNVSFGYDDNPILKGINLTVKPGERIAIVGYNGAGKTTLMKLLMRLYDPTEGYITYFGKDIRCYEPNEYRERIGVVFQDYKMFGESLFENVVLDDLGIEDEERKDAEYKKVASELEKCGFQNTLQKLSEGLDTGITTEFDENGVNLSGGESQKVAIARAFYRNADILAMDEPSSALDPIMEYQLNKTMHEAALHRTVFYISHRLSTTRDADRIIMLEKGHIIEEGTHDKLLEIDGKYAAMWQAQAGKYR